MQLCYSSLYSSTVAVENMYPLTNSYLDYSCVSDFLSSPISPVHLSVWMNLTFLSHDVILPFESPMDRKLSFKTLNT